MKQTLYIFIAVLIAFAGCTKTEKTRTSGIDTIDNTTSMTYTYQIYGFLFSQGKLVSTENVPGPDITVYVKKDQVPYTLYLTANNLKPSFSKVGDFASETEAQAAFDNLKTITATQWVELADPLNPNQVWIYRSGSDRYAKIRIVSTVNEKRTDPKTGQQVDYAECTFQWAYQPDGSLTFP